MFFVLFVRSVTCSRVRWCLFASLLGSYIFDVSGVTGRKTDGTPKTRSSRGFHGLSGVGESLLLAAEQDGVLRDIAHKVLRMSRGERGDRVRTYKNPSEREIADREGPHKDTRRWSHQNSQERRPHPVWSSERRSDRLRLAANPNEG